MSSVTGIPAESGGPRTRVDVGDQGLSVSDEQIDSTVQAAHEQVADALRAAEQAAVSTTGSAQLNQSVTPSDTRDQLPPAPGTPVG